MKKESSTHLIRVGGIYGNPRRVFSKEFKIEAVRLSQTSGKSDVQLARELRINRASLKRWRDELEADHKVSTSDAFCGNGKRNEEAERLW